MSMDRKKQNIARFRAQNAMRIGSVGSRLARAEVSPEVRFGCDFEPKVRSVYLKLRSGDRMRVEAELRRLLLDPLGTSAPMSDKGSVDGERHYARNGVDIYFTPGRIPWIFAIFVDNAGDEGEPRLCEADVAILARISRWRTGAVQPFVPLSFASCVDHLALNVGALDQPGLAHIKEFLSGKTFSNMLQVRRDLCAVRTVIRSGSWLVDVIDDQLAKSRLMDRIGASSDYQIGPATWDACAKIAGRRSGDAYAVLDALTNAAAWPSLDDFAGQLLADPQEKRTLFAIYCVMPTASDVGIGVQLRTSDFRIDNLAWFSPTWSVADEDVELIKGFRRVLVPTQRDHSWPKHVSGSVNVSLRKHLAKMAWQQNTTDRVRDDAAVVVRRLVGLGRQLVS